VEKKATIRGKREKKKQKKKTNRGGKRYRLEGSVVTRVEPELWEGRKVLRKKERSGKGRS